MHEIGIAQDILAKAVDAASKKGLIKISNISLKIGESYLVSDDEIKEAFRTVSKGSLAERAELNVKIIPLKAKCSNCGKDFTAAALSCPGCGGRQIEITQGQEMLVEVS